MYMRCLVTLFLDGVLGTAGSVLPAASLAFFGVAASEADLPLAPKGRLYFFFRTAILLPTERLFLYPNSAATALVSTWREIVDQFQCKIRGGGILRKWNPEWYSEGMKSRTWYQLLAYHLRRVSVIFVWNFSVFRPLTIARITSSVPLIVGHSCDLIGGIWVFGCLVVGYIVLLTCMRDMC